MGGLSGPPRPFGAARLTAIRWRIDPEAPGRADLSTEALVWLVRPAGECAAEVLTRVRPTAADLADAAVWEGAERGAARLRRRLLLRGLAAEAFGVGADVVEVVRESGGRPRIVAPEPAFASVARRGDWAALAIARRPVGVDLETVGATPDWSLLPPADEEALGDGRTSHAFAAAWSAREAYLKATGSGLAGADAVRLRPEGAGLVVEGAEGATWAHTRQVDGWLATALVL